MYKAPASAVSTSFIDFCEQRVSLCVCCSPAEWLPKTTTLWIICAPVQQGKGRVNEQQMVWFNKSERLFYLLIIYDTHRIASETT